MGVLPVISFLSSGNHRSVMVRYVVDTHAPRTGRYNVTARGVDVVARSSGTLNDIKGVTAVERERERVEF